MTQQERASRRPHQDIGSVWGHDGGEPLPFLAYCHPLVSLKVASVLAGGRVGTLVVNQPGEGTPLSSTFSQLQSPLHLHLGQ